MEDLSIIKLYKDNKIKTDNFNANIRSSLNVNTNYEKVIVDYEWLDLMEDTIRYLDNILRNPNRFIVNEEEIVKIELARRVTVESIRHLSKHTNFIQKIEDNGDVKPSKILNINKDESYDTYENRLIYTLIENMKNYVELKKKETLTSSSVKDIKKMAEESKVAVRAIRRDGIDKAKAMQKNSEITEDDLRGAEDSIQKITDKKIEEIDKILADKEKEILTV